jgi:hypothetical protein
MAGSTVQGVQQRPLHPAVVLLSRNSSLVTCLLPTVSDICCPKPRYVGHGVVFLWSLVSPVGICQLTEHAHVGRCRSTCHSWGVPLSKESGGGGALSLTRTFGAISFHTTVNTHFYFDISQVSVNQKDDSELTLGHFQHDWATCHISKRVFGEIENWGGEHYLKQLRQARSPYVTPPDETAASHPATLAATSWTRRAASAVSPCGVIYQSQKLL